MKRHLDKSVLFCGSFSALVLGGLFFYLLYYIQPALHYHIQQPPFLSNRYFFLSYTHTPGGILEYLSMFISQFFSFNVWGSLWIMIITGTSLYILYRMSRHFNMPTGFSFLIFIPVLLLPGLLHNYIFPFDAVMGIFFSLLQTWLFLFAWQRWKKPLLTMGLLGVITYYFAGSGPYVVFATCALIMVLFREKLRHSLFITLITVIASLFFPWLGYKFLFNIRLVDAYFSFLPDQPRIMTYQADWVFLLFVISFPVLILLFNLIGLARKRFEMKHSSSDSPKDAEILPEILPQRLKTQNIMTTGLYILNLVIILFMAYQFIRHTRNPMMRNTVQVDYYTCKGLWDKAIETALASEKNYNAFINFNFNRAIQNKGEFLDRFFDYPQVFGPDILFPNKITGSDIAIVSSDYYWDLGYMSESLHWAHEAQTLYPYSPRILKRMVMISLVFENYRTAEKYLAVLEDNFLSRNFVKKYKAYIEDPALTRADPEIMKRRACSPGGVIASDIETNFLNLLRQNQHNQAAYEHLLLYYLMDHRLDDFFRYVKLGEEFYSNSPTLFEEAILVYLLETDRSKIGRFNANPNTRRIFSEFLRIMKKYNNDSKSAQKEMYQQLGNSYLYYLTYYFPKTARSTDSQ